MFILLNSCDTVLEALPYLWQSSDTFAIHIRQRPSVLSSPGNWLYGLDQVLQAAEIADWSTMPGTGPGCASSPPSASLGKRVPKAWTRRSLGFRWMLGNSRKGHGRGDTSIYTWVNSPIQDTDWLAWRMSPAPLAGDDLELHDGHYSGYGSAQE